MTGNQGLKARHIPGGVEGPTKCHLTRIK
jgi:hypothetical protein